jgi:hypothetical protein
MTTDSAFRKPSHSAYNGDCAEVGTWWKSHASHANGNCAEVGNFRKSSLSFANGNCVEVGDAAAIVAVRDTQEATHPYRVTLEVPASEWARFTATIKNGTVMA